MGSNLIFGNYLPSGFHNTELENGVVPQDPQNPMSFAPYQEKAAPPTQQPQAGWIRRKLAGWVLNAPVAEPAPSAAASMTSGLANYRQQESRRIMSNGALQLGGDVAKVLAIVPTIYAIIGKTIGDSQTVVNASGSSSQTGSSNSTTNATLAARDVASYGTLSNSYSVVAPVVQSQAFWAMMAANGPIMNALNTLTGTLTDLYKTGINPWLANPLVANAYKAWDEFKKDTLYHPDVISELSPNLLGLLRDEAARIDRQFNGAMMVRPDVSNPVEFLDDVDRKKDAFRELIGHFKQRDLRFVDGLQALRVDNPMLVELYLDLETFKHVSLTKAFRDSMPAHRRPYLEAVESQMDYCLKVLIHSGKNAFTDVSSALQQLELQARKITQGYLGWEDFKRETLTTDNVAGMPEPIAKLLQHTIKDLEQKIDQRMNLQQGEQDDTVFMQQIDAAKNTVKHLIGCCHAPNMRASLSNFVMTGQRSDELSGVPDLAGVANPFLTQDFVKWQNYKTTTLQRIRAGLPNDERRNHFDAIVKRIERQFEIALYRPDSVTSMSEHIAQISDEVTGLQKAFVEWEDFKKKTLRSETYNKLPERLKKFVANELAKHDKNLAYVAEDGLATLSDRLVDGVDTIEYIMACYNADDDEAHAPPHKGVKNPILLSNFVTWEKYKQAKLTDEIVNAQPQWPREHLREGMAHVDNDFNIILYEEHARSDMHQTLQQIKLKNGKMQKFFLDRILSLEEVSGWTPEWKEEWKTPAHRPHSEQIKDEERFKNIIETIDRMTDDYLDDKLDSRFNKDLLNGFFLLDMARASSHVCPKHHKGDLTLKERNWHKDDDWHVWDSKPELPNLIYYLFGPPGVGKGRLNKIIAFLKRSHTNIEIPNVQQGGVASLWSALWNAFTQLAFPTSDKDDVGSLILQVLATKCANPIWMINEPDDSDPEGMKKLIEPYLTELRSYSIRSEFPVQPSTLVTTNHLPEAKSSKSGKAALQAMSPPMRDRGTVVLMNASRQKTVEQDVIDIYRGYAYYFCTPFANGAPARLNEEEQIRLQQIFKEEVFDTLVMRHRNNFEGSRMGSHVPAIMAKIVDRLLQERWHPDDQKKQIQPGEFKAWTNEYYNRYEPDSYDSENEAMIEKIQEKIRDPKISRDDKKNATQSFLSRFMRQRSRSNSDNDESQTTATHS